jgi:type IV secretory pathway VirB10-like protein
LIDMPKEKEPEFTVTDRRKFTMEGEPLPQTSTEETSKEAPQPEPPQAAQPAPPPPPLAAQPEPPPPAPTAQEQKQQADQYQKSSHQFDSQLQRELDSQGQGHKASDFAITFEKFIASLYMTALVQLGVVHEQGGQPAADLIGARQTIDTLSLIAEKTRGNLTPPEDHMLSNCLYELRMAYIEVTNALTRPPAGGMPPDPGARRR